MLRRGLAGTYKVFFFFMAFQPLGRVVYLLLNPRSDAYYYFYLARTPIFWVLYILVVFELYENILADYPGIVSFGKWVISGTFGAAVVCSLLTAGYDWNLSAHKGARVIFYYTFIDRGVETAQVLFLIAMTVFLRWFPAPLKRNVHVHTVVLFLYFLTRSVSMLVRNLSGRTEVTATTNAWATVASCLCILGWIWQLAPERADQLVTYRKVDEDQERRILGALNSVNKTLLGAAKRPPSN